MCRRASAAVLTRPGSPRGVLDDAVHPEAGGGLRRLFRWPHDRVVVADVRHGEPVRPRELTDGRHQCIGGRPADTDVYQVFADGVVGDRQPLGETHIDLVLTQRVGAVERREEADEVAVEGPDRRGGALNAVIVMRLLPLGDPIPPLGKTLIRDRVRLEDQDVVAHAPRLVAHPPPNHGHRSPRRPPPSANASLVADSPSSRRAQCYAPQKAQQRWTSTPSIMSNMTIRPPHHRSFS